MIRKLSLLLLSPLILFFSSPQQLYAQETQTLDVTVSPAIIEVTSLPGTTIHQKFRIRNNLSQPLSLTIFVDKLNGSDINGQVIPAPAQAGDQSVSWITFDKQSFTALPQEWTERTITLSIPKDAAFGYYYAIRLSQPSNSLKKTTTTNLLGEVAIPLLLTVKRDGAV
ncbi:MAG TPA: hypothetical protein VNW29_02190, partial [Candidatus Sulfotelmatobacter sp.]|nr:hypothetical protein [Candidatus Sulfotelmatobacter sp.]